MTGYMKQPALARYICLFSLLSQFWSALCVLKINNMNSLRKLVLIPATATHRQAFRCLSSNGKNVIVHKQIAKIPFKIVAYEYIKTETKGADSNIGLVTLNRPKALNALCDGLMKEVVSALQTFDTNDKIAAIVITGSEKAFAGKKSMRMEDK